MPYRVRPATLDDVDMLVHHRVGMFTDMGVPMDVPALQARFRDWLAEMMPPGTYRAWLVETHSDQSEAAPGANGASGVVVAGGGITILPWPPGPHYMGDRLAFVYNMYTEPGHRRRGLARLIMDAIHDWCREAGVGSMALNASRDGQPLYQSLGYAESSSPMMFLPMVKV
jgi:GNAT superfamily N-acetyltransferase